MGLIDEILDILFPNRYKKIQSKLDEKKEEFTKAYNELKYFYNNNEYFTKITYNKWKNKWNHLSNIIYEYQKKRNKLININAEELDFLYSALSNNNFLQERNEKYVTDEINTYQHYFSTLEKYPLTPKQCQAIVIDETRNLLVAGAGTGKTSTLIGKAGYIIKKGFAKPDEILLLSFGRDPRDEMLERAKEKLGLPLKVNTFHRLGMKIIEEAQTIKPRVSKLSTDQAALQKYIDEIIDKKKTDKAFLKNLTRFFLDIADYKTQWNFKTQREYIEYLKSQNLRSLQGDLVKSHQELEIANYLYTNGVEYEYEASYEHPTASKLYGQYKPDFFLAEYGIYLEHFGIDKQGNVAPFIDKQRYLEEMQWKRNLHREHGTTLIETYSYEAHTGELQTSLERKLKNKGVTLSPIPQEKVFERLNELGLVKPLSGLIATFLNLYKSNSNNIGELKKKASNADNSGRSRAFVEIFAEIYSEYEKSLASQNEIDFNDMIIRATEYVIKGTVKTAFKYILVDEFQDISLSRYKLVKALLDQSPESKLFVVGDDWQSIYRYAGSDLNIMTRFEKYFGPSETLFIDESFRFNNKICEFSTKFILENPQQIPKLLKPNEFLPHPAVTLTYTRDPQGEIDKILSNLSEAGGSVQILGRYNNQRPHIQRYPNLDTKFLTVHKSKGTQSDIVIILGLKSGIMGFPCEITDDPVLRLVTSEPDTYPHAEERRLFYVALTRAKNHVYLLVDPDKPSTFITEILGNGYEIMLTNKSFEAGGECPQCGGSIVKKRGLNGYFYPCNNFPYCNYKAPWCPSCEGHLLLTKDGFQCSDCRKSFRQCPSCGGVLVPRVGPYSRFIGCSNYPECGYTEKT